MDAPRSPACLNPAQLLLPPPRPAESPYPSVAQEIALNTLLCFSDTEILCYLVVIRSIASNFQWRPDAGHLSSSQLQALLCLSDVPDEKIKSWLSQSRRPRTPSLTDDAFASSALAPTPVTPINDVRSSSFGSPGFDFPGFGSPGFGSHAGSASLEAQGGLSRPLSRGSSVGKDGHLHWSTSRANNRQYQSCDAFRRQELERERQYVFMPNGPIEDSPSGPRCALCRKEDPNDDHLRSHNIVQEVNDSRMQIKKSRKTDFKAFLEKHNLSQEDIDRLLDQWCIINKKRAYSCGLCVQLFSTLSERTTHMCQAHFHRGENMDHWDDSNLIRGLLQQPQLVEPCRAMFPKDPYSSDSGYIWPPTPATAKLQYRLELATETPDELARVAFETAIPLDEISSSQLTVPTGDSQAASSSQNADTVPTTASTNERHFSGSITRLSGVQQHSPADKIGSNDGSPLALPAPLIDVSENINALFRWETQNLTSDRDAELYTGLRGAGSVVEDQIPHQNFPRPTASDGPETKDEQAIFSPPAPTLPNHKASPAPTPLGLSPSTSADPWVMPGQIPIVTCDTDDVRETDALPKRRLSDESSLAAHDRPQTPSPMESWQESEIGRFFPSLFGSEAAYEQE